MKGKGTSGKTKASRRPVGGPPLPKVKASKQPTFPPVTAGELSRQLEHQFAAAGRKKR